MRKIFLGLTTLILLFGVAMAVPNWGPPQGFHNKLIDADTITVDVLTAGVSTQTGAIGVDTTWGAGYDILSTVGDGKFDWSTATGPFKTSQGLNTIGGITWFTGATNNLYGTILAGGRITGAAVFSNGTVRGAQLETAGMSYLNRTKTTQLDSSTRADLNRTRITQLDVSARSSLNRTAATQFDVSGLTDLNRTKTDQFESSTRADLNRTRITQLDVSARSSLNRTAATQFDVSGLTGLNATIVARPIAQPVNATQTLDTVITATTDKYFYPIDASGANVTLTLPIATSNAGRSYVVMGTKDPGSYYIRITATSGSLIRPRGIAAGSTYLVSTDASPEVTLTSDGTMYWARTTGTWAQHAA